MAKQLFVCELGQSLVALRSITGRLPIGSLSITATSISADAAQYSSMSPARLLRNWCLRWEKMAMPICSGVITSGGITAPVASANVANFVAGQAAAAYRTSEGTYLFFATRAARLPLIRLLRPIRQPYFLLGALARPARVRHGLQLLMGLIMRLYGWLAPRATSACTARMAILAQSSTQAVG